MWHPNAEVSILDPNQMTGNDIFATIPDQMVSQLVPIPLTADRNHSAVKSPNPVGAKKHKHNITNKFLT